MNTRERYSDGYQPISQIVKLRLPDLRQGRTVIVLEFDAQTRVLNAPPGWNKSQPILCGMLPIEDTNFDGIPAMCSYWKPTAEELAVLAAGGHIRLVVYGTQHPPVWVDAIKRGDVHIEREPKPGYMGNINGLGCDPDVP
jgi:hypothetical protein